MSGGPRHFVNYERQVAAISANWMAGSRVRLRRREGKSPRRCQRVAAGFAGTPSAADLHITGRELSLQFGAHIEHRDGLHGESGERRQTP
jgi:hypothetical protein